jgi:xanthine/uracil permease
MGSPSYGLDVVALAFAVILAAALVLLISHLMPLLADVMPPVLSGNKMGEALAVFSHLAMAGDRDSPCLNLTTS